MATIVTLPIFRAQQTGSRTIPDVPAQYFRRCDRPPESQLLSARHLRVACHYAAVTAPADAPGR